MSTTKQECTLVLVNLSDQEQTDEFRRQRQICGWDFDDRFIEFCRTEIEAKTKALFWITIPSPPTQAESTTIRAGHISLDSKSSDPEIARLDKSILTITTLFVLPEHRLKGLGQDAFLKVEQLATQEPYGSANCRTIALNAVNWKFKFLDSEEWHDYWEEPRRKTTYPKTQNVQWYQKLGYKAFKEEPRFPNELVDGTKIVFAAVFLRKELR
ncbi:MAG: hypothetical protein M1820_003855 [Bogoriella megaspora]|nr:MAG: hypothetical protein M1820_003855 [Bogoriella megaspora]